MVMVMVIIVKVCLIINYLVPVTCHGPGYPDGYRGTDKTDRPFTHNVALIISMVVVIIMFIMIDMIIIMVMIIMISMVMMQIMMDEAKWLICIMDKIYDLAHTESSHPGAVCWSIRVARINQCSQMEKRDQRDPNLFQHLSLLLLDICENFHQSMLQYVCSVSTAHCSYEWQSENLSAVFTNRET